MNINAMHNSILKYWKTKSGYKITRILSGRSNVFLLTNGDRNIIIDTSPKRKWKTLTERLNGLNINQIDYLILTHSHFDHADNAARIKERFKAQVVIHKNEASCLTTGGFIMIKGTTLITRPLVNLFAKIFTYKFKSEPCQYDVVVDERLELKDFGFNAYIMHTPGHSPGSMSIIVDDEVALVGDAMFGVFKGSVFPPFAYDTKQMIQSWRKLLETNCHVFLPSHGGEKNREQLLKDYNKRK